jgi:hypothetical protein
LGGRQNFGQERNGVSSQIKELTTRQFGIEDSVFPAKVLPIFRVYRLDLADGSGFQELAKHIEFWKIKRPKRFGEKELFPASQFHHLQGLGVIEGDGFLHQTHACLR